MVVVKLWTILYREGILSFVRKKIQIENWIGLPSDLIFDRRFGIICMEFILPMDEYWNVLQPNLKTFLPPLTNQIFKK